MALVGVWEKSSFYEEVPFCHQSRGNIATGFAAFPPLLRSVLVHLPLPASSGTPINIRDLSQQQFEHGQQGRGLLATILGSDVFPLGLCEFLGTDRTRFLSMSVVK